MTCTQKLRLKIFPQSIRLLAQIVFLLSYSMSGNSIVGLKLIFLLCEIVTMLFLLKLLDIKGINLNYIILYAWLPLPLMEFFINAHIDVVGIMFLIVFLYFLEKEKMLAAVFAFAFSFLTKLYPIFLIPLLVKKLGVQRFVYFILIFVFTSVLFYFPFINGSLISNKCPIKLSE